jgi:hypothetical protein
VEESDDAVFITRGMYDGGDRGWTRVSGFMRTEGGLYERFGESVYNTAFEMARVRDLLIEAGFAHVHFARIEDLATPVADPEAEGRIFVVARPGG